MPLQLHCVMEHSTDPDDVRTGDPIEEEMAWLPDHAAFERSALTAMPEVIAANILAKFRAIYGPDPPRIRCHVA
jgi:hypothetical protein